MINAFNDVSGRRVEGTRRAGRRRRWSAIACLVSVALVGAACGDEDDGGSGSVGATDAPSATSGTTQGGGSTASTGAGPSSSPGSSAPAGEEITAGGDFVYLQSIFPSGMDPAKLSGSSNANGTGDFAQALYDVLMYIDPVTAEVKPKMAESLDTTDGLTWTLKLREGIEFTDGTPLDAEAIKYNWERIANPEFKSPNAGVAQKISSMTAVDPLTLEFTLVTPDFQFDRNVANQLSNVGSPTAMEALGAGYDDAPVGAGPFMFESWVRDSTLKLVKNPNYWMEGKPYLDSLEFRFVENPSQRQNSLIAGEADGIYVHSFYDMVPALDSQGYNVVRTPVPGGFMLQFQVSKPPFDDPIARQAVAYAIDRVALDQTLSAGVLPPSESIYPESHPFYDPDAPFQTYDREKAQELFDQYAEAHGQPLSFTITSSDSQKPVMEFIQAGLATFENVNMEIEITPPLDTVQRALAHDFEAVIFTMNWLDPEPDVTNFLQTNGGRNYTTYSSPEMDEAIAAGRASRDVTERAEAYSEVQQVLLRDVPMTYIRPLIYFEAFDKDVVGIKVYNGGLIFWEELGLEGGGS